MSQFGSRKKKASVRKLRVVVLASKDWGFTNAAVPKVRSLFSTLESAGADVQLIHSALIARFFGEEKAGEFERAKILFEVTMRDPDFDGFRIGQAVGDSENLVDEMRVCGDALADARKG